MDRLRGDLSSITKSIAPSREHEFVATSTSVIFPAGNSDTNFTRHTTLWEQNNRLKLRPGRVIADIWEARR
jgi:hypothetical protein